MEVCYVVNFKPQEVRAYSAELVVVTEREKFIVPVAALGHRAVLDFPDQVCAWNVYGLFVACSAGATCDNVK